MARLILVGVALVVGWALAARPDSVQPLGESRDPVPGPLSDCLLGPANLHPVGLIHGLAGLAPRPGQEQSQAEQGPARAEFKAAGVCARCHVVSVLEWGVSEHRTAGTTCQTCHGPSQGHVANERNEVKPDRLPRGAQITKTCLRCHEAGCPTTLQTANCQTCHHVHALVNPARQPPTEDDRLRELRARWEKFRRHMDEGERQIQRGDWKSAQASFQAALEVIPGDRRATQRLRVCKRRLNLSLPGFRIVGNEIDPQTGLPKQVVVVGLEIPMVLVPPGEFDLGADHLADAQPVHTVPIEAFYLGQFELTQAQWQAVLGRNPSFHQGKGFADAARLPVEQVSWHDCQALVQRLNERVPGGGFRLPTEAEWEYACRAGASGSGDRATLAQSAWFRENSRRQLSGMDESQQPDSWAPRPVGTTRPNRWGLYDLQGNVWEWCSSLARPYPYDPTDGRESLDSPGLRVLRGGSFADAAELLDPALRHGERPYRRYRWNGLRLARGVPE